MAVWDDLSEQKRELLLAYDELVCSECGNLRSECSDPSIDWHPRTSACWATATVNWASKVLRQRHEKDELDDSEMSYLDGRFVWVSRQPPDPKDDEFA